MLTFRGLIIERRGTATGKRKSSVLYAAEGVGFLPVDFSSTVAIREVGITYLLRLSIPRVIQRLGLGSDLALDWGSGFGLDIWEGRKGKGIGRGGLFACWFYVCLFYCEAICWRFGVGIWGGGGWWAVGGRGGRNSDYI